jgi:hypothetical protein
MRPPYGDIDDRVRAVCMAMGITPIIWYVVRSVTRRKALIRRTLGRTTETPSSTLMV